VTTAYDLDFVRAQFPAFSEPGLAGFAHLENAGGSWTCRQVNERLERFYRESKLQPYYPSAPSTRGGEEMDESRTRMAAWLNVSPDELHFGPSTSQNTYVVAQALRRYLQPGDEVIVTNQDHEANIGAWARLADEGITVREWGINPETAELETGALEALLNERTRAVAFTHCSNIVGSINPVSEWCEKIRAAGALSIVDGVSFAPHGLPDLDTLGADIYLFSLYKVYGTHQGVMYIASDWNERLPNQGHFFNEALPNARFTPAGPDHAQIAALSGVVDYFETLAAFHGVAQGADPTERVRELLRGQEVLVGQPLLDFLADRPGVRLIGKRSMEGRAPTVSFTAEGKDPEALSISLAKSGLGVGFGHFYAYRLIEALGIPADPGVLRCSLVHYSSKDEVARLIEALDSLL
jgi:cysteine desulfurase family protein (TIGR01976 family)